jgi:hypothetical protein
MSMLYCCALQQVSPDRDRRVLVTGADCTAMFTGLLDVPSGKLT